MRLRSSQLLRIIQGLNQADLTVIYVVSPETKATFSFKLVDYTFHFKEFQNTLIGKKG